jgi:hypothetical protein
MATIYVTDVSATEIEVRFACDLGPVEVGGGA